MTHLLARCFWAPIDTLGALRLEADSSTHTPVFALLGPERSGKTSLLFQLAYFEAQCRRNVVYLCDREKMHRSLPRNFNGLSRAEEILNAIQMKYNIDSVCATLPIDFFCADTCLRARICTHS